MLSYKLKHICSRIVASLSAFGLFSITANDANAGVYSPGYSFTYNTAGAKTFNAAYESNSCQYGDEDHIKSATYVPATGSGGTDYCQFTCADGYAYTLSGTSGQTTYTVNGSGTIDAGSGCQKILQPTCKTTLANGSTAHIAKAAAKQISGDSEISYNCVWTCENGYSSGGKADTTTTITKTNAIGTVYPTAACQARQYTVTFDCGSSGLISGTSNQSMTATATFGQTFTIPTAAQCLKDNYTFSGWSDQ